MPSSVGLEDYRFLPLNKKNPDAKNTLRHNMKAGKFSSLPSDCHRSRYYYSLLQLGHYSAQNLRLLRTLNPNPDPCHIATLVVRSDLDRADTGGKIIRQTKCDLTKVEVRDEADILSHKRVRLIITVDQTDYYRGRCFARQQL